MKFTNFTWLVFIVLAWMALVGPGRLEGWIFPAASKMELIALLPTDETTVRIGKSYNKPSGQYSAFWFASSRLRHPECSWRKFEWYKGERGKGNNVPVYSLDEGPPVVRGDGEFSAGPILIKIDVREFRSVHGDVLHQCSVFGFPLPWLTRTEFWN